MYQNVTVKNRPVRFTALLKGHDSMLNVQGMIASFFSWMTKMFATKLFKMTWYIEKHFIENIKAAYLC